MTEFYETYKPYIIDFGTAILIFIIGWIASKWANMLVQRSLKKGQVDDALGRFLGNITQYAVLAAAIIASLGAVGVETTSMVAIFASAGLAVGLALQGSLSNFASGVMILFFRPFNLGDKVEAGGHTGAVKDIGLFASTLLTPDNKRIIIPNSAITNNAITNYTVEGTLKAVIDVGIAYGVNVETALEVMKKAAEKTEGVLVDKGAGAIMVSLGASSLDCKVWAWCNAGDYMPVCNALRIATYNALNEAGIEIPFAQIVVHNAE